jgi:hypothetical protein
MRSRIWRSAASSAVKVGGRRCGALCPGGVHAEEDGDNDAFSLVAIGRSGNGGRDWFMGSSPLAVWPAPFLIFFSSIFSILLFYNSMLEFKSVPNDLEHMNLAKNILGY